MDELYKYPQKNSWEKKKKRTGNFALNTPGIEPALSDG